MKHRQKDKGTLLAETKDIHITHIDRYIKKERERERERERGERHTQGDE